MKCLRRIAHIKSQEQHHKESHLCHNTEHCAEETAEDEERLVGKDGVCLTRWFSKSAGQPALKPSSYRPSFAGSVTLSEWKTTESHLCHNTEHCAEETAEDEERLVGKDGVCLTRWFSKSEGQPALKPSSYRPSLAGSVTLSEWKTTESHLCHNTEHCAEETVEDEERLVGKEGVCLTRWFSKSAGQPALKPSSYRPSFAGSVTLSEWKTTGFRSKSSSANS